jgi:hypothetical protein
MSDLYKSVAGTVVRTKVDSPSFVSVDGMDGILRGGKMLLTSIRVDRAQDVQFLKTLSNLYYIYAFGEAPGKVQIGGLLFFADCESKSIDGSSVGEINKFYEEKNVYANNGSIRIAGGGVSLNCVLTGLSVAADMNAYNYASFSMAFTMIPPK